MGRDTTRTDDAFPDWWPYGRDFPAWHVWLGVGGTYYARRVKSSPPKVVRAKTVKALRLRIIAARALAPWWQREEDQ